MADKSWKAFERRIAKLFNTQRNPLSGSMSQHNTQSDSLHSDLYIECKMRKHSSLLSLLKGVGYKASLEHKTPVVAVNAKDTQGEALCIYTKHLSSFALASIKACFLAKEVCPHSVSDLSVFTPSKGQWNIICNLCNKG